MLNHPVPQIILETEQKLHGDGEVTSALSNDAEGEVENTRNSRSSFVSNLLFFGSH